MPRPLRAFGWLPPLLFVLTLALLLLPLPTAISGAQPQGATMTVLRGQVAVVRPDGSAVQPAPSGTTLFPGDEIRTVGSSDALITFFVGTEIEMGPDTVLVVERVSGQGDRIDVSLKQVFGVTLSRIQTLADPGSVYRIEAGGAVALIRGSSPAVVGPTTMPSGNLVGVGCGDCDPNDVLTIPGFGTFPLSPPVIYVFAVEMVNGQWVPVGPVMAFAFPAGVDPRNAVFDAITAFDQTHSDADDDDDDDDDEDDDGRPAVTTTTRTTTSTTTRRTTTAPSTTITCGTTTTTTTTGTTTTTETVTITETFLSDGESAPHPVLGSLLAQVTTCGTTTTDTSTATVLTTVTATTTVTDTLTLTTTGTETVDRD